MKFYIYLLFFLYPYCLFAQHPGARSGNTLYWTIVGGLGALLSYVLYLVITYLISLLFHRKKKKEDIQNSSEKNISELGNKIDYIDSTNNENIANTIINDISYNDNILKEKDKISPPNKNEASLEDKNVKKISSWWLILFMLLLCEIYVTNIIFKNSRSENKINNIEFKYGVKGVSELSDFDHDFIASYESKESIKIKNDEVKKECIKVFDLGLFLPNNELDSISQIKFIKENIDKNFSGWNSSISSTGENALTIDTIYADIHNLPLFKFKYLLRNNYLYELMICDYGITRKEADILMMNLEKRLNLANYGEDNYIITHLQLKIIMSISFFIIFFCCFVIYLYNFRKNLKLNGIQNKKAKRLCYWLLFCMLIFLTIATLVYLSDTIHWGNSETLDHFSYSMIIALLYIIIWFLLLKHSAYCQFVPYREDYLINTNIRRSIVNKIDNMASLRFITSFICLPLYYLFPLPILTLFITPYCLVMILLFYIIFNIVWIIKGAKIKSKE